MRIFILFLILIEVGSLLATDENISFHGQPQSQCYLHSDGKGPDGIVLINVEIQLSYLESKRPRIDEAKENKPEALIWTTIDQPPEIRFLEVFNAHRIVRVDYGRQPEETSERPEKVSCTMLLFESRPNWFRPFIVVAPELFKGVLIKSNRVKLAYTGSIHYSGSGGFADYYMFDLSGDFPRLLKELHGGRTREQDFKSHREYEKAIKEQESAYKFVTTGT